MDAILALTTRMTVPQAMMHAPGPSADQLRQILEAGLAAPDHGRLRPWRFLTVSGEGRAALGDLLAEAAARMPNVAAADIEKQRQAPSRAPLIIIVLTDIRRENTKIPAIEQFAAAAAAAQNMLVAAHALGFAGKWSTGRNAEDPLIRERLGVGDGDHIVGFLYIGSADKRPPAQERPTIESSVSAWP
ncbi:Nitroreductase [Arboricoccus pini]|uniref:Putative NAD(P)H nitroreductase n=1 Tax=Arboricoccus pini TaxID=1963835 RepID=A0A212Q4B4_9PROT|nr:nitroreductase [Arboricoccus pini]SNB54169.1 Nitroreductase [Arboricoccus pini]